MAGGGAKKWIVDSGLIDTSSLFLISAQSFKKVQPSRQALERSWNPPPTTDHSFETNLFHSPMIRPAGRGPHLPETPPCACCLETGSKSSTDRFLIHIDAQDAQDFFWRRLACSPGHPQIRTRSSPESASRAAASRPDYPVNPVHRCSIYSPSRLICPMVGVGCAQRPDSQSASRAAASGPVHPVPLPAARFPFDAAAGHPAGGNRIGPAEAEPWRRCRSIQVAEMTEAAGRFVRAGRPRSRGGLHPMTS